MAEGYSSVGSGAKSEGAGGTGSPLVVYSHVVVGEEAGAVVSDASYSSYATGAIRAGAYAGEVDYDASEGESSIG